MVLGTTYYNAARSAVGTGWNRPAALPAFRNACLALFALVAAVVAGAFCSPPEQKANDTPASAAAPSLPGPDPLLPPAPALVEKEHKTEAPASAAKKSTSVLLPPIQSLPDSETMSSTSRPRPVAPPSSQPRSPSLLDPPPPRWNGEVSPRAPAGKPMMESQLEVIVGQPHVVAFPDVPHRVALVVNEDDPLATLKEVPHRAREWYLIGKKPGTTFLDVWLPDPANPTADRVLHYQVRIRSESPSKEENIAAKPQTEAPRGVVKPQEEKPAIAAAPRLAKVAPESLPAKPQEKPRIIELQPVPPAAEKPRVEPAAPETIYQTLEQEINRTFPGSTVHLKQVGEMLVVSGTARNLFDATRILTVARQHAPGNKAGEGGRTPPGPASLQDTLDNYAHTGGPHVINLLRIPGEQQIMLRVIVAEVNRSAARSLGLDFGIADKQATILPRHPAAGNSSSVAQNGWIGELIRTLQDLNYAQSLAEPTLTTLNGQPARFQAGGEFPIPVVTPSAQGTVQGVAFRSYGVRLSLQPVLADVDRIRLSVEAEVSGTDPQALVQAGGGMVPGLKVRNFQSTVELREGETLAVAGLVRSPGGNTLPQNARPWPVNPASSDQELVVLVSPLLLRPPADENRRDGPRLNPQEIEMYLRSRSTMVPRGDALYLIGPQGYAGKPKR